MSKSATCDDCGRHLPVKSRYGGVFCATCYYKSPRRQCTRCTKMFPVPESVDNPLCGQCRRDVRHEGRTCVRCHRDLATRRRYYLPDGSISCGSCRPFVIAPVECAYCHEVGPHRNRDASLGLHEPACAKCRSRARALPLCCGCGRPRVAMGNRDGKPYCEACLPTGSPPMRRCRICRRTRPAYSRDACEDCSWERSHRKLIALLSPQLKSAWGRQLYERYHHTAHLQCKRGRWRVALKRDLAFFLALEQTFTAPEQIDGIQIARRLGSAFVHRYQRSMSFLSSMALVDLSDPDYAVELALGPIRAITQHPTPWIAAQLGRFLDVLLADRAHVTPRDKPTWIPTKPKSLLSCVSSARRFLEFVVTRYRLESTQGFTQVILNDYLVSRAYDRLHISRYVHFLNAEGKLFRKLRLPKHQRHQVPARRILPDARRIEIIRAFSAHTDPKNTRCALIGLFNVVYAQMPVQSSAMRLDQLQESSDGYMVRFASRWLELDPICVPLVRRWLTQRREISMFEAAGDNPYLFPGRRAGTHMDATVGNPFFRRHMHKHRDGRATAIASLIRNGLNHARTLVDCFGLSHKCANQYCEAFSSREHATARFVRDKYAPA